MKKEYIVFIDSGIGGLTTLSESIKLINRDYIFFADNKHAPYGSHSKKDIYSYIKNIIDNLLQRYHINNIILACNTATTSAIEKLRLTYPNINIIGTEPAVNLANKYGLNSAFCIATPTTIKQQKYFNLLSKIPIKIKSFAPKDLAYCIENYFINNKLCSKMNIYKYCYHILKQSRHYDCIILGCTHYIYIKNLLKKFTNKPIFDGNFGISKRLYIFLNNKKFIKKIKPAKIKTTYYPTFYIKNKKKISIKFLFSSDIPKLKEKYKKILNQILAKKHFI